MGPHAELAALHRPGEWQGNGSDQRKSQELGVNNPEQGKRPEPDPLPSSSFICCLFSQPVGFFSFCRADFPVIQCYLGISTGEKR